MQTIQTVKAVREAVRVWHRHGERVALVPTMGALHEGIWRWSTRPARMPIGWWPASS